MPPAPGLQHEHSNYRIIVLQNFGGMTRSAGAGGGTYHALALMREWSRLGAEVHFVTNSEDANPFDGTEPFFVHRVRSLSSRFAGVRSAIAMRYFVAPLLQWNDLKRIVKSNLHGQKRTCVIASSPTLPDVIGAMRLRSALGLPAVVYVHHLPPSPIWFPSRRGGFLRCFIIWALGQLALALVKICGFMPSLDNPETMSLTGWQFESGTMPDLDFLPPLESSPAAYSTRSLDACCITRLVENKGVLDLLRAWKLVTKALPHARLVIAGAFMRERFQVKTWELLRSLGLQDRVSLLDFISDSEKHNLLAQSRLFVFPSYEEGWSLSVMEAARFGTVPVVYDLPAYDYLGPEAIRVPVGNIPELAEAVLRALQNDEGLRRRAESLTSVTGRYRLSEIATSQLTRIEQYYESVSAPKLQPDC